VYSCAYFSESDDSLEEAQLRKLDLICRKLALRPGDRVLDIGCGWGSLVIHAATHYGARAVGITLSESQARTARERIRAAGVSDLCEIRVEDYREIADGPYDAIASVGMYEHVGREQLSAYGTTVVRLLRPGGTFLNHGIVRLLDAELPRKRFIDRFVFPDGDLHPLDVLLQALRDAGLEVRDVEALREHYGLTLRAWLANLARNRDAAIAAAGPERERVWRLYMTGTARAFERGELSVVQTLALMPGATHRLPLDRRGLLGKRAGEGTAPWQRAPASIPVER
jgi:cyclopropane-fatty-acyl-phospholipid synthase